MLFIGSISGLLMDYLFGFRLGWWIYIHHPYYRWDYFAFLIPAWAMMVSIFILFYKFLEKIIINPTLRLTIYFGIIPLQQEFMGISLNSWSYTASPALIGIGWILLLDSCVVVKEAMDWLNSPVEIKYYPAEVTN
jgi:hypothetical protein